MEETIDAVEYDPQIREQIGVVIQFIPREQISNSIDEETVDVSVLQIREQSRKGHPSRALATTHSGAECKSAWSSD